jgi:hypothetical protein
MPCRALALRSCFQNGMVRAQQGGGMVCVHQTWPLCVNQEGKTQSKPLGTQYGRRVMCESNMAALCKSNGKDTI